MIKKTGLGRGLDALIDTSHIETGNASSINEVEISKIVANPNQPRHTFDEEALEELAASIREHGVISPITVRKNDDGTYMIIAGERRWRASKMAGLKTIPAYVRTAKDEEVMEWALVENIQRENLDAIEISLAYQRLMEENHLTQEQLSERVGKKRATVANYLRLLKLPAEIQMGIQRKQIEMGHARAILAAKSTEEQLALYKRILAKGLSVRQVEELAAKANETPQDKQQTNAEQLAKYQGQAKSIERLLGTPCKISSGAKGKGKLVISFDSEETLLAILSHIK